MRSKVLLALAAAALVLAGAGMSIRRYWIRQFEADTQVLWHDDEAFILVGVNTVGWSGSYLAEKAQTVRSLLRLPLSAPQTLCESILVYRFDGRKLERHETRGLGMSASFAPYQGVLHRSAGGKVAQDWRWTGSAFERLSDRERAEFGGSFQYFRDLFEKAGWSSYPSVTVFHGTEREYRIPLRDASLVLTIARPLGESARAQLRGKALVITLSGAHLDPTVLYDLDQSWHRVTWEGYSASSCGNEQAR